MSEPQPFSRPVLSTGLALGVLLAALVCGAVAGQLWIVGSAEGGWTYSYVQALSWKPILVAAGSLALILPLTILTNRSPGRAPVLLLIAIVLATAAHWGMRSQAPHPMQALFLSPGANSFYTFAHEISPADLMAKFERVTRQAPLHARSNLPGKTLLIHGLQRLSDRPDVLPWLLVVLSNLGAILIFGVGRELFDDDRVAFAAALLYLFTPARVFFFPIMNAVTPVLVLAFAWILIRWLRTSSTVDAAVGAALLYLLVLFEPLPLVMGLFFLALALAAMVRGALTPATFVVQSAALVAFFVLTAVVVYETTGFHLVRAIRHIGTHAVEFNQIEGRRYGVWIRANLLEFFLAAGPAQVVLAFVVPMACWWRRTSLRSWIGFPPVAASLGLLAVVIVTDLIGINRGEVARLWIFLACFFQLPAAWACAQLGRAASTAVLATSIVLTAVGTATIGFVVP